MTAATTTHTPPTSVRHATRLTAAERGATLMLALACAALLGLAAWLNPSPTGVGTHEALGLPPCGWVASMNLPCPTCGMTTAYSQAAHGHLLNSMICQPMGALLAVLTATTMVVAAYVAATGSALGKTLSQRFTPRFFLAMAILAVAAWGYKILAHRGYLSFAPSPQAAATAPAPATNLSGPPQPAP